MREDYVDFIATANELIAEFGREVTMIQLDSAAIDVDAPWKGPGTPGEALRVKVMAVFVPAGGGFSRNWLPDELLARSDQACLVPPMPGLDGAQFHLIEDSDGTLWNIKGGNELRPGGPPVMYVYGVAR